ncbi:MAG: uracil-DNA glycosylase [Bacteroidota bacterium]|nr:uracil-DNA glycosylase [Bacteroidota bacterium]MDE2955475.1 uracil-DNA glycosylase [Bacteroidota bacterium]
MVLSELWHLVDTKLSATPSTPDLFNFYVETDAAFDAPGAAETRRANLRAYLGCFESMPDVFVLAEAPGPWGCRFSGVPVTSEAQLIETEFPVDGHPTSLKPKPLGEYTARIYWRVMGEAFPNFLTWNAVPLHPHRIGEPMSIRTPRSTEVKSFLPLLKDMLHIAAPKIVLAMGRTAERALSWAGWSSIYVRHPSQGGARIFERQVRPILARLP